jgi:protein tyrosine/serine phosphatase
MPLALVLLSFAPAASAQNDRKQIEGVQNFGEVTERYFRGGAVTPDGVDKLASMGVKTIIDLRDKPSDGEPEACKRNGITYHKFSMDSSGAPNDNAVNEILSIIQNAKEPVYVHCSAGKHRAGTIAALYRIRAQGWTKEQAWAEQQSYGFGPAEEHPALYAYVYGASSNKGDTGVAQTTAANNRVSDASRSGKQDDDEKDKSSKKADELAKSKKHDDDDDDDDDDKAKDKSDKKSMKNKVRSESATVAAGAGSRGIGISNTVPASEAKPSVATNRLSANAGYISMADAVKRAQAEGANGEVLKIDLEWDDARSTVTWDVTFSSGAEYEVDAISGKFLGAKEKAPAKLAVLTPLALNGSGALTFQEIIQLAEAKHKQNVKEMELKRIKGRSDTVYEVLLADGATLFYDAATGKPLTGL